MGVGDSLEAAYKLRGPIPGGTWHLVGDGILLGGATVDVRFEVVWRARGLDAGAGTVIASASNHFARTTTLFEAVRFATDLTGLPVPAAAGDEIVLRITPTAGPAKFDPNGDGANARGSIPRLDLPR